MKYFKRMFPLVCFIFLLVGCSSTKPLTATETTEKFIKDFKSGEIKEIEEYTINSETNNIADLLLNFKNDDNYKDFAEIMYSELFVSDLEEQAVDNNNITLNITLKTKNYNDVFFTYYDLNKVNEEADIEISKDMSSDDFDKLLLGLSLAYENTPIKEIKATVNLIKEDDKWLIDLDNNTDFIQALYGESIDKNI